MSFHDFLIQMMVFLFMRNDPCDPNPCENGGTCHYTNSTGLYCDCASNFTGLKCSGIISFDAYFYAEVLKTGGDTVDHCSSSPCLNNGTCSATETSYKCACPNGFTGQNCEASSTQGGRTVDHCSSAPCLNNGTCSATETSYTCVCEIGYTGENCQISGGDTVDPCFPSPCLNNGTCSATRTSYTCGCLTGYTGQNCETLSTVPHDSAQSLTIGGGHVDHCFSGPCLNDGTCSTTETNYTCSCPNGYTGQNCETSDTLNPCRDNPCRHGGRCYPDATDASDYNCVCMIKFWGKNCDMPHDSAESLTIGGGHVDPCFSAPCLNSGTCLAATETNYTCSCPSGYTGQNCETSDSLDPCFSQPCQNKGVCSNDGNVYKCECSAGFTGRDCETRVDPCGDNPCLNGGRCYPDASDASDYNCVCTTKFRGKNCDIYKD